MSKVVIQGNASGTGNFTIAAPNSNTDRTFNLPDEAGTIITTAGVPASALPAGSVLQVVSANKTDTQSVSSAHTGVKATDLTVSITPVSSSSKFLLMPTLVAGAGYFSIFFYYYKDGSAMTETYGDTNGVRTSCSFSVIGLDTGATSPVGGGTQYNMYSVAHTYLDSNSGTAGVARTYDIYFAGYSTSYPVYLNRIYADSSDDSRAAPSSTFTVMEIAG